MAKHAKTRQRRGTGKKCLHCRTKAVLRGCCEPCYRAVRRDIAAGRQTDQQAIKLGLLLPPNVTGRPTTRKRKPRTT